jgi:hypothetical protein
VIPASLLEHAPPAESAVCRPLTVDCAAPDLPDLLTWRACPVHGREIHHGLGPVWTCGQCHPTPLLALPLGDPA